MFPAAAQGFIGLLDLLEALYGFRLFRVMIWMKFLDQATIGLFDFSLRRIARNSENFIRIGNKAVHRVASQELNV